MSDPKLIRGFGLLQATALNMSNMIGVGPFITIPLLLAAMNGPQGMLGWLIGALIAMADGLIWSELGAAMPGSGGSYVYLREAYGRETFGRMMAFLFIWQFILSGPLEIASGCIGFAQYMRYLLPHMTPVRMKLIAAGVGALAVILLYRKITSIGKLTVTLWAGTLLTMLAVILGGLPFFNRRLAFDFPPGAFNLNWGFFSGLGMSTLMAVYAYLGYYDVCYIGDEVKNPGRVIPRSIIYSLLTLAVLYTLLNVIIVGVLPWQEAKGSVFVVSDYVQRIYGSWVAAFVTLMILWTAVGSVVALLLGYSRVPYAAALGGHFFSSFAKVHPQKKFPHVSLIVLGVVSVGTSLLDLADVISALMTTRIIVQFMGQILAVTLLRRHEPDQEWPYKMWLYPLPSVIAFAGWAFVFASAGRKFIVLGLGTLALGVLVFLLWSWRTKRWPFAASLLAETPTDPQVKIIKKAQAGIPTGARNPAALGVLGGLFNPITQAHIALAEKARQEFSLDEVILILPEIPPHKEFFGASLEDRLAMMRLALAAHDRLSAGLSTHGLFSDIHRGLEKIYPAGTKVYFIAGTDAAERILTWPYADPAQALADMFHRFELIVAHRGSAFQIPPYTVVQAYAGKIHTLRLPAEYDAMSSTLVRERIREGRPINDMVPEPVRQFIVEKGLYKV